MKECPDREAVYHILFHRINSDYGGTLMTLATILVDTGRIEEGIHFMQRAINVAPQDTLVRNNMANFYIRQGTVYMCIYIYVYILLTSSLCECPHMN